MSYDNITDAWTSVVFAKIPSSALPTHGILVRLMSSIPDLQVYNIERIESQLQCFGIQRPLVNKISYLCRNISLQRNRKKSNLFCQDKLMYTITLYKNRQITILKSFLDSSGEQREIVQIVQLSDSFKWLSHLSYTGFWIIYKQGLVKNVVLDSMQLTIIK